MAYLVVTTFLCVARGIEQSGFQSVLLNQFNVPARGERAGPEPRTVEIRQRVAVSDEPRLHHLDHQMTLLIRGIFAMPLEVLPRS